MASVISHPSASIYVGLRFRPSDEELLLHYLFNKVHGLPYFQGAVFDFDLYGGSEPWEFWESFRGVNGEDLYFFTKLKRSTNNSGRLSAHISRKVGLADGTWSGENSATSIFRAGTNHIIGYCKRFRYENSQLREHHGEWIMHEYSLHESLIREGADGGYVLCRIRKNERVTRKGKKRCFSELQPDPHIQTEQRIMAPEMINSRIQTDQQRVMAPEMIYNLPEMTTREAASEVPMNMMTKNGETTSEQWPLPDVSGIDNLLDFSGMDDFQMGILRSLL